MLIAYTSAIPPVAAITPSLNPRVARTIPDLYASSMHEHYAKVRLIA